MINPAASTSKHSLSVSDQLHRSSCFFYLVTDSQAVIRDANKFAIEKLGINPADPARCRITDFLSDRDKAKCMAQLEDCAVEPGMIIKTNLCFSSGELNVNTSWETMAIAVLHEHATKEFQWIGNFDPSADKNILELWERYEAYEYSSEGLWKINLREPIPADTPADLIIEHCKHHAYLSDCNDNMAMMYGFSKAEELVGSLLTELMDLDDAIRRGNLKRFIESDFHLSNVETKEFDREGNTLYFRNNMTGIVENGMLMRIWGTQQDITETKLAEEKLQRSEQFYRSLIADSLDGMLLTDKQGIITFASASVQKILGFTPEELCDQSAFSFLHPEDRPMGIRTFYEEVEQSRQEKFITARLKQKSGNWLWCMIRGHNLMSNPQIRAMLIYFSDDTARRNAELAVIESERRYRNLISDLDLGIIVVNPKGEPEIVNQAAANMLQTTEEELYHLNIFESGYDLVHDNGEPFLPQDFPVSIVMRTHEVVRNIVMGVRLTGSLHRIWVLVSAVPVLDEQGNLVNTICCLTDITEQKSLSQQLMQQEVQKQKLLMQATIDGQEKERREIGRELHDNISQHLTTTRLYVEVAKDKAEGELLNLINRAHKGLLDIVTEIRQLSQSLVPPSLSDIGLVESIEDLCEPLKTSHGYIIEFYHQPFDESRLPDNMRLMLFRIIQEQINNIVRHAETRNVFIGIQTLQEELLMTISDNGKGFNMNTIKRGLGFDNIATRVDLFRGKLKIDASPGKGCSISVSIPLS